MATALSCPLVFLFNDYIYICSVAVRACVRGWLVGGFIFEMKGSSEEHDTLSEKRRYSSFVIFVQSLACRVAIACQPWNNIGSHLQSHYVALYSLPCRRGGWVGREALVGGSSTSTHFPLTVYSPTDHSHFWLKSLWLKLFRVLITSTAMYSPTHCTAPHMAMLL